MEEFTRPATLEDIKTLLRSLNTHRVDYLLTKQTAREKDVLDRLIIERALDLLGRR